ncbi:MAG: hypothetical protein Q3982_01050 [Phoenicibacter congonensis]|uniref:4-diphosphocytidyl-2-C-methyl-D-erythritol kinase n=1 Tax=Phoenicibacter congonensis TaxID=1944646 RepID=A0AA43RG65_9ACTN|nr:hypothetical protein [Phoenicibacter congonensis]
MKKFSAIAPAKINLTLKVAPLAEDKNKHEVETVMQTVTLHDTLFVSIPENEADELEVVNKRNRKINDAYGIKESGVQTFKEGNLEVSIVIDDLTGQNLKINGEDNLVTKAFCACAKKANLAKEMHIEVLLEKNIPAQAGLGGGSSDAAAALAIAKELFGLSDDVIAEIAAELGSDIAFFLNGGRAKMAGDGSVTTETLDSLKCPVLLVRPNDGVSTAECYAKFDELNGAINGDGDKCAAPQNGAINGDGGKFAAAENASVELQNDLQEAAVSLCPEIKEVLNLLSENCGSKNVLLCGSGSCCFGICESFDQARKLASLASKQGYWSRACSCVNLKGTLKN